MKKSVLLILIFILAVNLHAQKDVVVFARTFVQKDILKDAAHINVIIYPIPVKENRFTIKTDMDVAFIKITNIIGQDIFRAQYSNPQQLIRILLDSPKRGMYLVTIIFSNGTRVVKKIMVEESE
jgi:hypothetical protein